MYMEQSLESFENWRDSQYDRPEPDTEAPNEARPAEGGHDTKHPVVLGPIDAEENGLVVFRAQSSDAGRGCIGHLRGDFGSTGNEFFTSWFDHMPQLNHAAFRQNCICCGGPAQCGRLVVEPGRHAQPCRSGRVCDDSYGFYAETPNYEYCLRCTPRRGEYNFYLYCYDKQAQREHREHREQSEPLPLRQSANTRNRKWSDEWMYLNELMNARQMSRTELSARSRVPESTLRDILSGKTQLDRCEAATLYDLAGALQVSIEDILENYWEEMNAPEASRPVVQDEGSLASFYMLTETFLEQLHAMGELAFVQGVYGGDWIRRFFNGRQYRCALFLLGLVIFCAGRTRFAKMSGMRNTAKCAGQAGICSAHARKDRMRRTECPG